MFLCYFKSIFFSSLNTFLNQTQPTDLFYLQFLNFSRFEKKNIQILIRLNDAGASINTPNIGNSALMIEELDWGGQDALNTCENSFFGPHLGLGRQKNVIRLGQTPDVKLPY